MCVRVSLSFSLSLSLHPFSLSLSLQAWKVKNEVPLGAEQSPREEPSSNAKAPAQEYLPHPKFETRSIGDDLSELSRGELSEG